MNTYQLEMRATCPNGQLSDRYDVTIESQRTIQVERIIEVANRLSGMKLFQEDLADMLRNELQATVKVVGWHFEVKVTCVRE